MIILRMPYLFFLTAVLIRPVDVHADKNSPDWFQAQHEVTALLIQPGSNLAELVKQVNRSTPTDGQAVMFNLCVLSRAGISMESIQALRDLKRICPKLDNYQVSSIYYDACDHLRAWDLAEKCVEVFADNISELCLDNRLLKHLLISGWSIERVDEWLASKPKGIKNFWVKERLRFNMQNGRGETLMKELANRVRANPKDVAEAIAFLDALIYARTDQQQVPDLAWIAEIIKPELATDAHEMALRLVSLQALNGAVHFYRQAMTSQLTDKEVQSLGMMCQVFMPEATVRASFAAYTREGLTAILLKMDKADEAQKWMLEASDIREKNNLGRNALFAGQVQGMSGQRVIEEKIKSEEKISEKEPKYWRERAVYYLGRKEPIQEESALKKGWALTETQPASELKTEEQINWHTMLLSDYTRFLKRENRDGEAVALLLKEIAELPAISELSSRMARMLAFDFEKYISPDEPVLWTWLENRPKWQNTEERLLWHMLEKVKQNDVEGQFARAEKLAFSYDPSRAHTLGWIENRMKFPQRSLPLLEYAFEKAQDNELKERAAFSLLESYLDTGDWKRAEAIFPKVTRRLTPNELPEWYSKIAIVAAKAGEKADAMRIWGRVANLDLSATGALEQLVKAGLSNELIDFYLDIQKTIPSSDIPPKVLNTLQKHDAHKSDASDNK